jgi:hypothetical protein
MHLLGEDHHHNMPKVGPLQVYQYQLAELLTTSVILLIYYLIMLVASQ